VILRLMRRLGFCRKVIPGKNKPLDVLYATLYHREDRLTVLVALQTKATDAGAAEGIDWVIGRERALIAQAKEEIEERHEKLRRYVKEERTALAAMTTKGDSNEN